MGGGSYSYERSASRGASYAKASRQEVFKQRGLATEMNINGKVRESCDSEEHPNSYPIIIALDMTGSMGQIPHELISGAFPTIMKNIMEAGVQDAQICFVGVGDDIYDDSPIQAGQFETSDELTEKWLKKLYIEGGGGGNFGESYGFAWYFASRHTKIDSFEKRGKKGCLITIGDEPILIKYSKNSLQTHFGGNVQGDIRIADLYGEVSEKWNVYHVNAHGYVNNWEVLPEGHLLNAGRDINSIAKEIIKAILESYGTMNSQSVQTSKETSNPEPEVSAVSSTPISML